MPFPSEKELKKVRKKLERAKGFQMLDPDADEVAKFRFKLCQELLKYARKNSLNSAEMAKNLGITKADMSRIFNHRIERFSTDRLLKLCSIVKPDLKLKVA